MSHYGPGRDWVRRCVAVCGRPRSDKVFAPRSTVYRRVRRVLPVGKDPVRGRRERVRADFHVIPCRDIGRHYLRY